MLMPKTKRRSFRFRTRRALIAVGTVAGTTVALTLFAGSAGAVHDTTLFQLDGNAQTSDLGSPASTGADDWDRVCHEVSPTACPSGSNTTGATAVSWTAEANPNSSIFTGGGSKDPQDISNWAWKDAGGLPDKDNLQHGFATRYSVPSNANCPGPNGNTDGTTNCDVLYFGSDRFDNSGDAQQGFWFFQNKVTLGNTPSGGGFNFNGVHKPGDILVISDFSNGGTTSFISVYKWNPSASGNLQLLSQSGNARCDLQGATDAFCGVVNSATKTMPWSFTDKSGTANNGALNGEFYEGGINLSKFGLGGECFSSIASETRSSTSTTATLKDFVLGQFAVCGASMTTTPSTTGAVSPGDSVTDTATVTATGATNPPTPSGDVTFFLCSVTGTNTCDSGGTQVGSSAVTLSGSGGTATATSSAVNTSANPLLPGKYCFRAEWPGDNNYPPPTPGGKFIETNPSGECFTVRQINTATTTTPKDANGNALTDPLTTGVALGTVVTDVAVVTQSGASVDAFPPGTVDFFVCNPNQTSVTAGSENCAANTGSSAGADKPLSEVLPATTPRSSKATSDGVTLNLAGVWCFRATYKPTGTTFLGSNDTGSHTECVKVNPAQTTTTTTPKNASGQTLNTSSYVSVGTAVHDHAVVSGNAVGGWPMGSVNFYVCDPTQLDASGLCSTGGTFVSNGTLAQVGTSNDSATDSTDVTANKVGKWCFRGEYDSSTDPEYLDSSDSAANECFTVRDSTSSSSEQDWLPNDTVHVSATGSTPLNGTLSATLYLGDSCAGDPVQDAGNTTISYSKTLTNATTAAERSLTTSNTTYKVTSSGSVSWKVVFTPTDPTLVSGSSHCESTTLTITN